MSSTIFIIGIYIRMFNLDHIRFYLINAQSSQDVERTLNSFYKTTRMSGKHLHVNVVEEKRTREYTLNHILENHPDTRDLLIFVDDIIFTEKWLQSLANNYENGDIIGFAMVHPESKKLQDFGYDFVTLNNHLTYEGKYKGRDSSTIDLEAWRECDAITGCVMFIKAEVLKLVKKFPVEGRNRIGELLYSHIARQHQKKTIVLGHSLFHFGTSTKQSSDPKLGSISWKGEKEIWDSVVKQFLSDVRPSLNYVASVGAELQLEIESKERVMMYGCGTVAAEILKSINSSNIVVVSGLIDEIGTRFFGYDVFDVARHDVMDYDLVIISPVGHERDILDSYYQGSYPKLPDKFLILHKDVNNLTVTYKKASPIESI